MVNWQPLQTRTTKLDLPSSLRSESWGESFEFQFLFKINRKISYSSFDFSWERSLFTRVKDWGSSFELRLSIYFLPVLGVMDARNMGPCTFQDSHYTAFFLEFNAWTITLYCMNYLVAFNSFKKFTYRCTQSCKFWVLQVQSS